MAFRLTRGRYEGLEGGCVPVVIQTFGPGEEAVGTIPTEGAEAVEAVTTAFAPLDDVTGAPPPFVVVREPAGLPAALRPLLLAADGGAALDALQTSAREWWEQAKRHYASRFERAVCAA